MNDLPTLQDIEETFSLLDDWEDRYAYVIDLGRKLPPMSEADKTDTHIVKGCTSRVWMILSEGEGGRLSIQADSDAHIVKGLIALLIIIYDGTTAAERRSIDIQQIFDGLGLSNHLSPNRRNGFFAMVSKITST